MVPMSHCCQRMNIKLLKFTWETEPVLLTCPLLPFPPCSYNEPHGKAIHWRNYDAIIFLIASRKFKPRAFSPHCHASSMAACVALSGKKCWPGATTNITVFCLSLTEIHISRVRLLICLHPAQRNFSRHNERSGRSVPAQHLIVSVD